MLAESHEFFDGAANCSEELPVGLRDEVRIRILDGRCCCGTSNQQVPLLGENEFLFPTNAGADQERINLLMRLEQSSANIGEHLLGDGIVQVLQTLLNIIGLGTLLHGHIEQLLEECQRKLVHRVDQTQLADDKVQDCAPHRNRNIVVAARVDLLLNCCGFL